MLPREKTLALIRKLRPLSNLARGKKGTSACQGHTPGRGGWPCAKISLGSQKTVKGNLRFSGKISGALACGRNIQEMGNETSKANVGHVYNLFYSVIMSVNAGAIAEAAGQPTTQSPRRGWGSAARGDLPLEKEEQRTTPTVAVWPGMNNIWLGRQNYAPKHDQVGPYKQWKFISINKRKFLLRIWGHFGLTQEWRAPEPVPQEAMGRIGTKVPKSKALAAVKRLGTSHSDSKKRGVMHKYAYEGWIILEKSAAIEGGGKHSGSVGGFHPTQGKGNPEPRAQSYERGLRVKILIWQGGAPFVRKLKLVVVNVKHSLGVGGGWQAEKEM